MSLSRTQVFLSRKHGVLMYTGNLALLLIRADSRPHRWDSLLRQPPYAPCIQTCEAQKSHRNVENHSRPSCVPPQTTILIFPERLRLTRSLRHLRRHHAVSQPRLWASCWCCSRCGTVCLHNPNTAQGSLRVLPFLDLSMSSILLLPS